MPLLQTMGSPPREPAPALRRPALVLAAASLAAGCRSAEEWRDQADGEVYRIVEARRAELFQTREAFHLEPQPDSLRQRVLQGERPEELGHLGLLDCLRIASESSREWQDRRESLYLAALDLTFARWTFSVQPEAGATATAIGTGYDGESSEVSGDFSLSKLLGSGAEIVGTIGLSLFNSFGSGDPTELTSSFGLEITQPLLRGFGGEIVLEPLTQAERDVVYEARTYERFRRTFAVSVADRVYRVLQQVDVLENEKANHQSLEIVRERNEALAQAGRLSDIQVDQARQDEFQARSRVIEARQRLDTLLDDLKFFLGLPVELEIGIDPAEFERLSAAGVGELALDEHAVVTLALMERLDYRNSREGLEDSERAVYIAADELRPGLDVDLAAQGTSEVGRPLYYSAEDIGWTATLDLDLPVNRLPERNAYRAALIALDAARRGTEALADSITAGLRDALRQLEAAREEYAIQRQSVVLAENRVESTQLNFEAGRAETRDLLDAQEALVNAQNAATRALVDYELARLSLWRDLEALRVDEQGIGVNPGLAAALGQESP